MQQYTYFAKDKEGKSVKGKVEAKSLNEAARLLRDKGLIIIRISPRQPFFLLLLVKSFANKVGLADIAIFTRQFATMVNAGLPLTDALSIVRTQSSPGLQTIMNQVLSDIEGGMALADSFAKHPKVFSPVYISLVRAGETGGVLDKIFTRLAENLEKQREFQAKVKGALIYPVIVMIAMAAVMASMMIFVIPKLTSIYKDFNAELPLVTKIMIAISNFLVNFWWSIPILIIGGIYGLGLYKKTEKGRLKIDEIKLKIPVMGKLQKQIMLTEFARTLGLLVGSGIPILQGLSVVSSAVDNKVISSAISEASTKVEKGFSLAYALSQEPNIFPPMLYQMLAVGEETGKVDETLLSVSHVFEQESEYSVRNLTAAMEPLIMIFLGVVVGVMVVSIILPIFNLTKQF